MSETQTETASESKKRFGSDWESCLGYWAMADLWPLEVAAGLALGYAIQTDTSELVADKKTQCERMANLARYCSGEKGTLKLSVMIPDNTDMVSPAEFVSWVRLKTGVSEMTLNPLTDALANQKNAEIGRGGAKSPNYKRKLTQLFEQRFQGIADYLWLLDPNLRITHISENEDVRKAGSMGRQTLFEPETIRRYIAPRDPHENRSGRPPNK